MTAASTSRRAVRRPADRVKISVPATTANLGPGFDALGLALSLSNDFTVARLGPGKDRTLGGGTCANLPDGPNVFHQAMDHLYALARRKRPGVEVKIDGRVPLGRGLGSSATAVVGGLLAANALLGEPFTVEDLLGMATEIEGHPDNVAPALLGSLTASVMTPSGVLVHVYRPHACWRFAALVPGYELPTHEARKAIPKTIPHADAVHNLTRVPFIIEAIVDGDADILGSVMQDRLHEPYRKKFIRGFDEIRAAGLRGGAPAVYLSGAGPTMAALCAGEAIAARVARAMSRASAFDPDRATLILKPDLKGAKVKILG